ncbi:hypothetical protein HO133_000010 [Letharia lupina]|uniref:Uncharacterized protein n=1 Tax=Letharia lupina TaxID=560253 RepID=A0A8H6FLI2_9LECA|nr:uncharacterized protein HO133_000010 [Letharia lupina]KAF6230751.1 hypothetical protein HO133_000010 [Letharia lupina]
MPITREESDAWLIMQGDTQERLDRIHAEADAMRARLEAEGRGPSTVWEPVSSDDEEFEDIRPMTPPMSPPCTPRGKSLTYPGVAWDQDLNFTTGARSKENESVNMEIQRPKLGDTPLQNIHPAPSTSPQLRARKVQRQRQRRTLLPVSGRSKASKTTAFYELAHDNKTSRRVSSIAPMGPPKSPGLKQPNKSSPQQKPRSAYRVQKR